MKVKVVKARKALGIAAHMEVIGLEFRRNTLETRKILQEKLYGEETPESILEELESIKNAEKEFELYKKPVLYKDRKIKVVDAVPCRPRSEIIYVSFNETSYEIKSGRNFIHRPIIEHGNLRYACVDLEHLMTAEERNSVLEDLVRLNNGKLV